MPLGETADIVSGITLGREFKTEDTVSAPYLRVANVKDGFLDLGEVLTIAVTRPELEKLRLRQNDLLLTEGGDPDKLGRGALWRCEIDSCVHQNHIFRVRLHVESLVPEFVSFQMASRHGKDYFLAHAKQTTGIASINQKILKAFPLQVPPLQAQLAITDSLRARMVQSSGVLSRIESEFGAVSALPASLLRRAFSGVL